MGPDVPQMILGDGAENIVQGGYEKVEDQMEGTCWPLPGCKNGHQLIHVAEYNAMVREKNQLLSSYKAENQSLLRVNENLEKVLTKAQEEEAKTMNGCVVETDLGYVRITQRGKSKIYTLDAVADLIKALTDASVAASRYQGPIKVHCTSGFKNSDLS